MVGSGRNRGSIGEKGWWSGGKACSFEFAIAMAEVCMITHDERERGEGRKGKDEQGGRTGQDRTGEERSR